MILRNSQHKEMLWKNGGGITYEIDREPKDNVEEIDWRLSMALIKYPGGPFSIFPNIDRTLAIFHGNKLTLTLEENQLINLEKDSSPFSFPGELKINCQIYENTLTDLNIMTKRNKFQHFVERLVLEINSKSINISRNNENILFIILVQGNLLINQISIQQGDAIKFIDKNQIIQISNIIDKSILFLIQIFQI